MRIKKWIKRYRFFVFVGLAILAAAGTYGLNEYNRKHPDTHQLKAAFKVAAVDLIDLFEADASTATKQYADKVIDVHGFVSATLVTDTSGTVFLKGGTSLSSVMCHFDQKAFPEMTQLRHGDLVTIKGICSGYLMDVVMVRCIVVDKMPLVPELSFFSYLLGNLNDPAPLHLKYIFKNL
jgi:tRNA_anti-like